MQEQLDAAALRRRAASLPPPGHSHDADGAFRSFHMGGFECSGHRRRDWRRLDLSVSTGHLAHAAADFRALARHGIRSVRDGLHWPRIERWGGYDWSSFVTLIRAARAIGTQVLWDLCHWGWPDGLEIWSPAFPDRFARFAAAAARVLREESDEPPIWVPINEISFWAWAGGDVGYINPFDVDRGDALKVALARAAILAARAVRAVDPRAQLAWAEPVIHVAPRSDAPEDVEAAASYTDAQHEALDLVAGRLRPDLGGGPELLDLIGANYYCHNQWVDGGPPLAFGDPRRRPFRHLLGDLHRRYGRPVFVAETGIEGGLRAPWLRVIGAEVAAAQAAGARVEGLCLYPVTDYPGWDDDRLCPTGLLGAVGPDGARPVHAPLARELALQQAAQRGWRTAI